MMLHRKKVHSLDYRTLISRGKTLTAVRFSQVIFKEACMDQAGEVTLLTGAGAYFATAHTFISLSASSNRPLSLYTKQRARNPSLTNRWVYRLEPNHTQLLLLHLEPKTKRLQGTHARPRAYHTVCYRCTLPTNLSAE